MRSTLRDQKGMVRDIRTGRTIVMGDSILVIMKSKPQDGERKANEQETDEISVHQPVEAKAFCFSATRPKSLLMNFNGVCLPRERLISLLLNLG